MKETKESDEIFETDLICPNGILKNNLTIQQTCVKVAKVWSYLIYSFVASSSPVSSIKQMVFARFLQDWTLHLSKCQKYC